MKKYLFVSLLALLAHVQTAKAADTDVSTKDNLIYAMPLTAGQGEQRFYEYEIDDVSPSIVRDNNKWRSVASR